MIKGTLENWCVHPLCFIIARFDGKQISTSRVVSRDGNTITTKSGSVYELGQPLLDGQFERLDEAIKEQ